MAELDKQDQTILGIAALFSALVRALGEQDKHLALQFSRYVQHFHLQFSQQEDAPLRAMEMLTWASDLLSEGL